jgi:hypothetical protein
MMFRASELYDVHWASGRTRKTRKSNCIESSTMRRRGVVAVWAVGHNLSLIEPDCKRLPCTVWAVGHNLSLIEPDCKRLPCNWTFRIAPVKALCWSPVIALLPPVLAVCARRQRLSAASSTIRYNFLFKFWGLGLMSRELSDSISSVSCGINMEAPEHTTQCERQDSVKGRRVSPLAGPCMRKPGNTTPITGVVPSAKVLVRLRFQPSDPPVQSDRSVA